MLAMFGLSVSPVLMSYIGGAFVGLVFTHGMITLIEQFTSKAPQVEAPVDDEEEYDHEEEEERKPSLVIEVPTQAKKTD